MKQFDQGPILRALRIKAGFTQDRLAEELNRTRSCVSKFENNRKVIDMPTFMQWVSATNMPEVAVAMMYGMDGIQIINDLLPLLSFVSHFALRLVG